MEVTLLALKENGNIIYKVTKRVPELQVSETMVFRNRGKALAQFHNWSNTLL